MATRKKATRKKTAKKKVSKKKTTRKKATKKKTAGEKAGSYEDWLAEQAAKALAGISSDTTATKKKPTKKKRAGKAATNAGGTAIAVVITVRANQVFQLDSERPAVKQIKKDFKEISCVLDPEPPCTWKVTDLKVEGIEIQGDEVNRTYSCSISIDAGEEETEDLKEFMEEEGYYDDGEFDWIQAANYFIADTTGFPGSASSEYGSFDSENVNLDLLEIAIR